MAASVREAAELLTVIAGSDPRDPATRYADKHKRDYAAALDAGSIKGKRIGVLRFASTKTLDGAFNAALAILRAKGAILVDIKKFDQKAIGKNENLVLSTELKVDMAKYLKGSPAPIRVRTLGDLIAFDKAHDRQEMGLFGQEYFEMAEKTKGLDDPVYKKARKLSFEAAGPNGIDRLLKQYHLVALVGPTTGPAWHIDAVNDDLFTDGGAGNLAAVAGYPHLTVPMALVRGLPVGLSFMGPKWSEAELLSLGYAYEQARGPFPAPRFYRSIEESPEIAPLLQPHH
jgi:amidase